jgi:hypothetical protein|tara:strand:+ start:115 stop:342 length:228 start_codon:yes stop_codon:yes gene_type:complete
VLGPHPDAEAGPHPEQEVESEAEDVPILTGSSAERDTKERRHFSAFVNSKDFVMVAYGAPWCPWSRRMEPVCKAP